MSLLPKQNFRFNREIPLPEGLINGQALGAVSGMKFGLSNMGRSGCEVIAVYNSLLLHRRPVPFLEVARYMERFRVLFGFWGANFLFLGHCLKHYGLRSKRVRAPQKVMDALMNRKTVVYVYWVKKRFRSSVHTVVLQMSRDDLCVYNAYNQCGNVLHIQAEKYLCNRKMIFGYIIEQESEKI